MTEWRDVPGYEGLYQVSSDGMVRSVDRTVLRSDGTYRFYASQVLNIYEGKSGYMHVILHKDGKRKNMYVHRMVADAFIPKMDGKDVVNHKDYDRRNNTVNNLEWCTCRENIHHSLGHMRKPHSGAKYMGHCMVRGRDVFRVTMKGIGIDKKFPTEEDAIRFRNSILSTNAYFSQSRG
jgi:hypothetical protein